MATLTVTNSGSTDVFVSDLYCTIGAGKSVSTDRAASDLPRMKSLQSLVAAGTLAVSVVYTSDEKASGLVDVGVQASGPSGIGDTDTIRIPLTAGGGGSADDVAIYALGALPYKKMRILDVSGYVSAGASAGRTVQVRTASGGAGTLCGEIGATANGRQQGTATVTASQVITNGSTVGLFARRSDSAIAGEIVIVVRPEV